MIYKITLKNSRALYYTFYVQPHPTLPLHDVENTGILERALHLAQDCGACYEGCRIEVSSFAPMPLAVRGGCESEARLAYYADGRWRHPDEWSEPQS